MVRALPYVVPLALAIYALIDFSRSERAERADLHPAAWVAIIVLLPVLGPIAWIVVSRSRRAGPRSAPAGRSGGPGRPQRPAAQRQRPGSGRRSGPLAPDDDPDFLWRLDQQKRRAAGGPAAGGVTGTGATSPAAPTTGAGSGAGGPASGAAGDVDPGADGPEPGGTEDGPGDGTGSGAQPGTDDDRR